jgi:hypothetical protein
VFSCKIASAGLRTLVSCVVLDGNDLSGLLALALFLDPSSCLWSTNCNHTKVLAICWFGMQRATVVVVKTKKLNAVSLSICPLRQ